MAVPNPQLRGAPSGPPLGSTGGIAEILGADGVQVSNPTGPTTTIGGANFLVGIEATGAGASLVRVKVGQQGQIKTLVEGTNIQINDLGDELEIVGTAMGGSPSVGNGIANISDGGGGWAATNWQSFTGDDWTLTAGSGVISALNGLTLQAPAGVLGLNASGTDFIASLGGGNNTVGLQSAGTNLIHGLTGGALPGDVSDLQINGLLIPSVTTATPGAAQYRLPPTDGGPLEIMQTTGAGQWFFSAVGSSQIINNSGVTGATVTDALNTLNGAVGGGNYTQDICPRLPNAQQGLNSTALLHKFIAGRSFTASHMGAFIANAPAGDDWYFALYDASNNLLAVTAAVNPPTAGFARYPFLASVALVAGTEYWACCKGSIGSVNIGTMQTNLSSALVTRQVGGLGGNGNPPPDPMPAGGGINVAPLLYVFGSL